MKPTYHEAGEGSQAKAAQLTFEQVKKMVDETGFVKRPACPDAVINEILKSKNPVEKIQEIRKALDEIAKAAGSWADFAFYALANDKVAGLFVSHADAFVQIAKAAGSMASDAFYALSNDKIAGLFASHADAFAQIAKAAGSNAALAFYALANDKIAGLFVSNPTKVIDAFAQIAKAAGSEAAFAFYALSNDKVAGLFASHADAFVQIAKAAGSKAGPVFYYALSDDKVVELFLAYCDGKASFNALMIGIKASDSYAIELGRKLDELHENEPERRKYLASLSKTDVLALLLSNPEYFYTSSNHMLFDRLNRDFKPGELADFLKANGIEGTELYRNMIFRAANYDRLYGKKDSIFREEDMPSILEAIAAPLASEGYDSKYFYLLANAMESFEPPMRNYIGKKVVAAQASLLERGEMPDWAAKKKAALTFLVDEIMNPGKNAAVFDADKYRDKDGKLLVVQVFSKADTEKDHWKMSQKWFAKYGKPKKGASGELIYETKEAKIVLYMGENEEANQKFVGSMLGKSPNMILTFRGHSFSLGRNIPKEVFANRKANVLFIPGSCGSAGSVPAYMDANPNTSFEFVSNTSTGKGQVTNALIDIFVSEAASGRKRTYKEIVKNDKNNCSLVEKNGGKCSTLKVDTIGERLIKYVNAQAFGS